MGANCIKTLLISTSLCFIPAAAFAANPAHLQRLRETNQCPNCDLSGANLEEANLFGANLINANLRGANLSGTNLGSANLTDANLSGANLSNAYLYRATLDNTNFSQGDLSNAYLREAILTDANLVQAKLSGVNLSQTNLIGLDLQGVDLSGANLEEAILSGFSPASTGLGFLLFPSLSLWVSSFCYEPPPDESFESLRTDEDLAEIGVAFANLEGANLTDANLSNTVLIAANLKNTNLSNADLTTACLTYSHLHNATLDGANLKDALLYGAIFENASVKNVKNADLGDAYRSEREARSATFQPQAQSNLRSMAQSQKVYYVEHKQFATALDDLDLEFQSDTEFYRYEILPSADPSRRLAMVAKAKVEGLKSYIGAVFWHQGTDRNFPIQQLCETEDPSTEPPAMPRLTDNYEIECAAGSVAVPPS
ncbi:MAG: pentapeptide repeat-containing protein [Cyanobacteriota bacterium]|nr:pentapeptide repeat-containing protein [Cyanobacteriota bacterium]